MLANAVNGLCVVVFVAEIEVGSGNEKWKLEVRKRSWMWKSEVVADVVQA